MTRNRQLAEDLSHDCCVRVLEKKEMWNADLGEASQWIKAVSRNVVRRKLKQNKDEYSKREPWFQQDIANARCETLEDDQVVSLLKNLNKMPEPYRMILKMRFYEGKKMIEIARELNVSQSTASYRLDKALDLLRRNLKSKNFFMFFFPWKWNWSLLVKACFYNSVTEMISLFTVLGCVFASGHYMISQTTYSGSMANTPISQEWALGTTDLEKEAEKKAAKDELKEIFDTKTNKTLEEVLKEANEKFTFRGEPIHPRVFSRFNCWSSDIMPLKVVVDVGAHPDQNKKDAVAIKDDVIVTGKLVEGTRVRSKSKPSEYYEVLKKIDNNTHQISMDIQRFVIRFELDKAIDEKGKKTNRLLVKVVGYVFESDIKDKTCKQVPLVPTDRSRSETEIFSEGIKSRVSGRDAKTKNEDQLTIHQVLCQAEGSFKFYNEKISGKLVEDLCRNPDIVKIDVSTALDSNEYFRDGREPEYEIVSVNEEDATVTVKLWNGSKHRFGFELSEFRYPDGSYYDQLLMKYIYQEK